MKIALRRLTGRSRNPDQTLAERYPAHSFGPGTYGDLSVRSWGEGATLKVGAYTSIASGVQVLLGGEHRMDWATTYPFNVLWDVAKHKTGHPKTKGNVVIGSDVWVGTEALILSGVEIGHGAVVGARSVVAANVPPYAVVAGNPARLVRYRFSPAVINRLLALSWWNWPESQIRRALDDLMSPSIELFLEKAERSEYRD